MSAVIASQSSGAYFAFMSSMVMRLLTLVALVLMPFGMGAASAVPAAHAPAAAHCEDQGSEPAERSSDQAIDCAMACSMVATAEPRTGEAVSNRRLPADRPLAQQGTGLHPDTATPPPKPS
ncbi:hypothetical protein [Sphingomonas sp.]|uniref:hypothetical protein n=1 Tax=Sphingomonas sp. TaxID=28214 RepID=UPI0017F99959|nr:hypothetical protein [Sphingomonas sp.]MBA3510381.1 hypothetical protein [Sphingomonas sp.]